MPNLQFHTRVSGQHEGIHYLRQWPLADLVGTTSFAAAVFMMITGQKPSAGQEKLLNALLVASMDHGVSPASGFVPRVVTSTGNNMVHSLAAGILALGPYHGCAIEDAAKVFVQVRKDGLVSLDATHFEPKQRILGFGHPHYKEIDPRAEQLFGLAREEGLAGEHQRIAYDVQKTIYEKLGKHLVINIDGAIAALLLDIGFPPEAGNGLFALARTGGMIAHILEEQQEKPVRRIDEHDITFEVPQEQT